jgi:hypothetical protein
MIVSGHFIERPGIHEVVPHELINRAVQLGRPGPRNDIDLPTASPAHVRGVVGRLHLKFVHRIGRKADVLGVECGVGIGDTIDQKVIGVRSIPAEANRRRLSRPPVQRIHISRLCAMTDMCTGYCDGKIEENSPIQRQFLNRFCLHNLARACVGRLEQFRSFGDINGLVLLAHGHLQIEPHGLAHLQPYRSAERGKASCSDGKNVITRRQVGQFKQPCIVGVCIAHNTGFHRTHFDVSIPKRLALCICNAATRSCKVDLSKDRSAYRQKGQKPPQPTCVTH